MNFVVLSTGNSKLNHLGAQGTFNPTVTKTISRVLLQGELPPLVVVALAPGAITADWAEEADAALVLFLGGA